jgi:hypothetical protein
MRSLSLSASQCKEHLWHKFQALASVVKYVTRTYSSKPFAKVEDAACLRSDSCHSTRLLEGRSVTENGIVFDHRPHLNQPRKDRKMRCVSCHSQIVQGTHMAVKWDTCFLCHIKEEMKEGKKTTTEMCMVCHEIPKGEITLDDNLKYRHADFLGEGHMKVGCDSCHIDMVQGAGEATNDKCFFCHNDADKLSQFEDVSMLHASHVTDNCIACFHCHEEIKHGLTLSRGKTKSFQGCGDCHSGSHNAQEALYKGVGFNGLAETPSPMYLADVKCASCHLPHESKGYMPAMNVTTSFATEEGCLVCHGNEYKGLLAASKKALSKTSKKLKTREKSLRTVLAARPSTSAARSMALLLDKVKQARVFIDRSRGIHNVYYSAQILWEAERMLNEVGDELALPRSDESGDDILSGRYCISLCHTQVGVKEPKESFKYKGDVFPHAAHYEVKSCRECHEFEQHKTVKLRKQLPCEECH